MDYLTPAQCRAARALLNWSQPNLAKRCGMHVQTISAFESETGTPTRRTLTKITDTLEQGGIEFLPNDGVGRRASPITVYRGTEGFRAFMDDVYEGAKEYGGDICLLNAKPENWTKWLGQEWYENHTKRMQKLLDRINFKVTCKEGDTNFIGGKHSEYRWVSKEIWNEQSFYAYGDRIGFLRFEKDDVEILVMKQKQFADSFRFLFNIAWDQITIIPNVKGYKPEK